MTTQINFYNKFKEKLSDNCAIFFDFSKKYIDTNRIFSKAEIIFINEVVKDISVKDDFYLFNLSSKKK